MRKNQKLGRAVHSINPSIKKAFPALALAAMAATASAATNIYEPFNYATGQLQGKTNTSAGTTANGLSWLQAGTGNPPAGINVTSGSLTGPIELVPPVGNDLSITHSLTNDGAMNRLALNANVTTGTVFYSFLLNVPTLTNANNTTGAFFMSLNNSANVSQTNNPTTVPGKVQIRIDPTDGTKYNLGIFGQAAATTVSSGWATNLLDTGTTNFIVAGVSPSTKLMRLWINPDTATFGTATVPATSASWTDTTTWSGNNIQSILLRQNLLLPDLVLDELRVGNGWGDVTPTLSAYWDLNGATGGAGTTPNGTWDNATSNWSTSSTGDAATGLWPGSNYKAVFSAGTDATGSYTVTVSGTQSATSLAFEEGTVLMTGGNVNLSTGVLDASTGVTASIASTLGSTVGITKNGAGTIVLPGNQGFTGSTDIAAGILQIGDGGTTGTLPTGSTINNNATLAFNRSDAVTQGTDFTSTPIGGTGGITQMGAGGTANLILNAANTYTGVTVVTGVGGKITATNSLAMQGSTIDTSGGAGSIEFDNALTSATVGGLRGVNNYTANTALALTVNSTVRNASFGGVISGTGSVTKTGAFAQELFGANSYSGGSSVSGGTLQFSTTASMPNSGAVAANSGGILAARVTATLGDWSNATSGIGSLGGLIAGDGGQTAAQVTWNDGSSLGVDTGNTDVTYSGDIGSFNGTPDTGSRNVGFAKRGLGTLTLTGTNNTFRGQLQIATQGGTLRLTTAVPNAGAAMVTPTVLIGNTNTAAPSTLKVLTNNALPINSVIQFGSANGGVNPIFRLHEEDPTGAPPILGSYNQTVRGVSGGAGILQVGAGTLTLDVPTGESYSFNGTITSGSDGTWDAHNESGVHGKIIKTGAGRQDFSNNANDGHRGEFVLQAGTIGIPNQQTFGQTAPHSKLTIQGGTILSTAGGGGMSFPVKFVEIAGSFTWDVNGAGNNQFTNDTFTLTAPNPTITVLNANPGNSGQLIFFSKIIESSAGYGFTKSGPGTLNISPSSIAGANNYSGATTIQQGSLRLVELSVIGNTVTPPDVNLSGGQLEYTGAGATNFRLLDVPNPVHVTADSTIAFNTNTDATGFTDTSDPNGVQFLFSSNTVDWTGGTLTFQHKSVPGGMTVTFRPRFSGTFNYAGPVVIANGTLATHKTVMESTNTGTQSWSGNITGTGSYSRKTGGNTVFAGSLVSLGGTIDIANNSVIQFAQSVGNDHMIKTGLLTIGGTSSQLDLENNKAIVTSDPNGAGTFVSGAYTGISKLVRDGMAPVSGDPTWTGNGIVTTQADAGFGTSSVSTTLAVARAGAVGKTTFGGQTVGTNDALVMYTYNGDANLSGFVDADDYFQIDSNYNKSGTSFGFNNGDFNYDGVIDGDDFALIDAGYAASQSGPAFPAAPPVGGVTAVPEPAGATLLALAAATLMRRRRRA